MNTLILFRNDGICEKKRKEKLQNWRVYKKIWGYKECDELVWLKYLKNL